MRNSARVYVLWMLWATSAALAQQGNDKLTGQAERPATGTVVTYKIPHSELPIEFVYIRGGTFIIGADRGFVGTRVRVDDFWLARHEITWELCLFWARRSRYLINNEPFADAALNLESRFALRADITFKPEEVHERPFHTRQPAVGLSQFGAQMFCEWLGHLLDKPCRLPTEAEWEYAARAGTQSLYFFGDAPNDLDRYAIYADTSQGGSHSIGTKAANPWGLYDMYGNVAEWTLDGWGSIHLLGNGVSNPWIRREPSQPRGVVKGGDWKSPAAKATSASRVLHSDTGNPEDMGWWDSSAWVFEDDRKRLHVGFRPVIPVGDHPKRPNQGYVPRFDNFHSK